MISLTTFPASLSTNLKNLTRSDELTKLSHDVNEDGALREDKLLIPFPSFVILVLLTFYSPSTRVKIILVDVALKEDEPLIPLPSFVILVLLTFSSPSTRVKST
ncbi:Uncharacterized protein Rs2_04335 [Raphanus sativus]|nr:Uncharacterized protein Rs2_04335 [Raphanus sativus]